MSPRLGWVLIAVLVLLLVVGLRMFLSRDAPVPAAQHPGGATASPTSTTPSSTTPSAPTQASGDQTVTDELPVGVDPPPIPLIVPSSSATSSSNSSARPSSAPTQAAQPTQATQPPAKTTPQELIHRQKHDLLKPKDW